jgi:hypothetical protein
MSYPHAVATGNAVIAAALAWDAATEAWDSFAADWAGEAPDLRAMDEGDRIAATEFAAIQRLRESCAAHRAATATEHVQGPDMDARS